MLEIGSADLALCRREARPLFRATGVDLGEAELAHLLERTEGWPTGLYLASAAITEADGHDEAPFNGDDRS